MRFTAKELISIENTVEKLLMCTRLLSANDQAVEAVNMRAVSFIISTMRNSAQLLELENLESKIRGFSNTCELFANDAVDHLVVGVSSDSQA